MHLLVGIIFLALAAIGLIAFALAMGGDLPEREETQNHESQN